jgi:hypothetical protein
MIRRTSSRIPAPEERVAIAAPGETSEPQAAVGEASPLGGEARVNSFTALTQSNAAVAPLAGGGYVIAFVSDYNALGDIYQVVLAQRFSAAGAAIGDDILVTPGDITDSPVSEVVVTGLTGGGFVIAWSQTNPQAFQTNPGGVFMQRYDANGVAQGGNVRIAAAQGADGYLGDPAIVSLADGGYIIAWTGEPGALARRYNSSGTAVGGVITFDASGQNPAMARLANGNIAVAWSDSDGSGSGVFKGIYNVSTGALSSVAQVNVQTTNGQTDPAVAVLADGSFVVTWESVTGDGSGSGIYARRYNSSGTAQGGEFLVNVDTDGNQVNPSIAPTPSGGFIISWTSNLNDGNGNGLHAATFDASGTRVGDEFVVNQTQAGTQQGSNGEGQAIAQLTNGRIVATWDGQGPGDTIGIFQRQYEVDVNDLPNAVNDSAGVNEDSFVDIAVRGNDTDADGHSLTITAVSNPPNGSATINANGTIRYTPDPNFNGVDSFTYTISDGFGGSDTASVTVTVNPVDDLPTAAADSVSVNGPTPTALSILANDPDIDGGAKTVMSIAGSAVTAGQTVTLASGATARLNADGTITYTHFMPANRLVSAATAAATGAANFQAADSFTYALNGGSSATVSVTINGTDEPGDFLIAPAGDAAMSGTAGGDLFLLHPSAALTIADAGAGDDGFYFGASFGAGDSVNGGAGAGDQIALRGVYSLTFAANAFVNVETIALLSGSDTAFEAAAGPASYALTFVDANVAAGQLLTINANGLAADEAFTVNGAAESDGRFAFYAGFGAETLTGGAGSDGFFFGAGRLNLATDRVDGLTGADDQLGLRGDFSQLVSFASLTIRNIDTIALISAKDPRFGPTAEAFRYNLRSHDDNLAAGAQMTVTGAGLAADESLAFDGAAELDGMFRLFGGAGADSLTGGALGDIIYGGLGADLLAGGGGDDRFIYLTAADSVAGAADVLAGFASGDKIDLAAIDAVAGGADDAFAFIGAAAFTAAGQVRLVQNGAEWLLEANVDADLAADLAIAIIPLAGYTPGAADIIL